LKNRKYVPQDTFTILDVDLLDDNKELSLEERFNVLNKVFSDGTLIEQINYDLECEIENSIYDK
jgi:hypothetical protein